MAMASEHDSRHQAIVTAITAELERQAKDGAPRVDVDALAQAIELAVAPPPPASEGKRPEDLNANNDD